MKNTRGVLCKVYMEKKQTLGEVAVVVFFLGGGEKEIVMQYVMVIILGTGFQVGNKKLPI